MALSNYFQFVENDELNETLTFILKYLFYIPNTDVIEEMMEPTYNVISYLKDCINQCDNQHIISNCILCLTNIACEDKYLKQIESIDYLDFIISQWYKGDIQISKLRLWTWTIRVLAISELTEKEQKQIIGIVETIYNSGIRDGEIINHLMSALNNMIEQNGSWAIRENKKVMNFIIEHTVLLCSPIWDISIQVIHKILSENSQSTNVEWLFSFQLFDNLTEIFYEYVEKTYFNKSSPESDSNSNQLQYEIDIKDTIIHIVSILYYYVANVAFAEKLVELEVIEYLVKFITTTNLPSFLTSEVVYLMSCAFQNWHDGVDSESTDIGSVSSTFWDELSN